MTAAEIQIELHIDADAFTAAAEKLAADVKKAIQEFNTNASLTIKSGEKPPTRLAEGGYVNLSKEEREILAKAGGGRVTVRTSSFDRLGRVL